MATDRRPEFRSLFQRHPLFHSLTAAELDDLLQHAKLVRHPPRATLFSRGDPGGQMIAVVSGRVRISLTGPDGHELILNVIEAGQLFGEIAMLDGRDRTADATIVEATELLIIDRRDFLPFLARHSEVAVRLMLTLCERMRTTTDQIEDIFLLPITARLAKKLLQIAMAHGEAGPKGVRIGARLSQRELGGMLGVSRESINKHLGAWQKAGLVRIESGAITVLDRAALGRLADGGIEPFVEPLERSDKAPKSRRRAV
ncbi:MAG: Crp/Fnr family transcriptional regulator [Proteobacteria bacterium]|nr:Crp/Fnr family transcriptional regulator [Pseudomonadota bacterium]